MKRPNVSRVVLDASAVLVLLNREPGADRLTPEILRDAICSTVNLAEVLTKLISAGGNPVEAWEDTLSCVREAIPFTEEQAQLSGGLVAQTRSLGLSLGDRACLSLGILLKAPIYTAAKSWKNLKLGVPLHVLR